jgi:hypothetical protein
MTTLDPSRQNDIRKRVLQHIRWMRTHDLVWADLIDYEVWERACYLNDLSLRELVDEVVDNTFVVPSIDQLEDRIYCMDPEEYEGYQSTVKSWMNDSQTNYCCRKCVVCPHCGQPVES